jgi:hypothetical protein
MSDESTAVLAAPPAQQLAELQATMKSKEDEYAKLNAEHTRLWQLRKQAKLDREDYVTFLMTSDRMEVLLRELEALKPQLLYAEASAAVDKGRRHYDSLTPATRQAAELVCQRWAAFVQACGGFVEVANERIAELWQLPDAKGQPAFPDLLEGSVLLQRMIQMFPHQPASLIHSVLATMQVPMTVGNTEQVLQMVPGPFPETLVRRFLSGYQPPTTEGATHADD